MKEIKLTNGFVTQVDDDDYEYLSQFKWTIQQGHKTYYARKKVCYNGEWVSVLMHREIMKTPKGLEVDHRDHNGLNNQRSNLRNCTHAQNQMNKELPISTYRGVKYVLKRKKWKIRANIKINGKTKHLGYFKTEEDAARAYNEAALKYFGEFANPNLI